MSTDLVEMVESFHEGREGGEYPGLVNESRRQFFHRRPAVGVRRFRLLDSPQISFDDPTNGVAADVGSEANCTWKQHSRRLEKSHGVWMMMMIAASLIWAGASEKPEQSKITFKNNQNDSKQHT